MPNENIPIIIYKIRLIITVDFMLKILIFLIFMKLFNKFIF